MKKNSALPEILELIKKPAKSVICLHRNPDLDSIGSSLAMSAILEHYGHDVTVYSPDNVSEDFDYLAKFKDINHTNMNEVTWSDFDVYWALDQSEPDRNGFSGEYPEDLTIVNIDHHHRNPFFGNFNYVFDTYSTASILLKILHELDIDIDESLATALMTGVAGDTGFFEYASGPLPFTDAHELTDKGAEYQLIADRILRNMSFEAFKITGEVIDSAYIDESVGAIICVMTRDHVKRLGGVQPVKGIIEVKLQSIQGYDWGILIYEDSDDKTRISFRSKKDAFDTSRVAEEFGGGGHPVASGAYVDKKPVDEIIQDIVEAAKKYR